MTLRDLKSQLNALPLHDFTDTPIESVLAEGGQVVIDVEPDTEVWLLKEEINELEADKSANAEEIRDLNKTVREQAAACKEYAARVLDLERQLAALRRHP